jgi:hypothetical protein
MAAIYAEIGIGGKKDGIGERFGHAHEAGIPFPDPVLLPAFEFDQRINW